ncbi:MAG TPA: acyl-CoA thioesterase [Gemmatimonadota bacterium]|jgi:acyl-CoA hydrolase|nr:acyl-CoA thioesterase [Gemmatimonadota bacterium]
MSAESRKSKATRREPRGGDPSLPPKPVSASRVMLSLLATPESRNLFGNVHGGWILRQVDEAAYVSAARHAGNHAVTASIERVDFRSPIRIGDLVQLSCEVQWVGRTSMMVGVHIEAEDILTGAVRHTNTCVLTYVAIDKDLKPVPVPGLILETEEEEQIWRKAEARRVKK